MQREHWVPYERPVKHDDCGGTDHTNTRRDQRNPSRVFTCVHVNASIALRAIVGPNESALRSLLPNAVAHHVRLVVG